MAEESSVERQLEQENSIQNLLGIAVDQGDDAIGNALP